MERSRSLPIAGLTALAVALVTAACGRGDDAAAARGPVPKPDGLAAGGEALVFPEDARADPQRARADVGGLAVRAYAPSPVGLVTAENRDLYRVVLQAENVSDGPIVLSPAWASVRLERGGQPLGGCEGAAIEVPPGTAVAPGGALFVSLPAPCAIEAPGQYELVVELSMGAPPDTRGAQLRRTATTSLVVDERLPVFRAEELPPLAMPPPAMPPDGSGPGQER
jgi:hypothetical protein